MDFFCEIDWAVIPDWINAVATIILIVVACVSLNTWKNEYKARVKDEAARKILGLIYQIQSHFWLEPVGFLGDKRLAPEVIISQHPERFIQTVASQAKVNWNIALPLLSTLKSEFPIAKLTFGNAMQDKLRTLVSYLEALRPGYSSNYTPTPTEMNGETLTADQFTERIIHNSVLKIPKLISEIENELDQHLV